MINFTKLDHFENLFSLSLMRTLDPILVIFKMLTLRTVYFTFSLSFTLLVLEKIFFNFSRLNKNYLELLCGVDKFLLRILDAQHKKIIRRSLFGTTIGESTPNVQSFKI